jgi:hypothetical protein
MLRSLAFRAAPVWRFHALETEDERRELADEVFGREHSSVHFVESREVGGLWLKIQVMSHTIYDSGDRPGVVATGWVPAYDSAGNPIVWFYSRD